MRQFVGFSVITFLCLFLPASLFAQKGDMLDIGENRLHNGDFEDDPVDP